MKTSARVLAAAILTTSALAVAPVGAHAAVTAPAKTVCTKTSTNKCIKAGQFCAKAENNKKGRDAKLKVLVCKLGHWHAA